MEALLQKPGDYEAERVNLRATSTMLDILECLEVQGYIILKEATSVPDIWAWSVPDLSDNEVEKNKPP